MSTWTLTPTEYEATRAKVSQINDRAVRRGFAGRLALTGVERQVTETGEGGTPYTHTVVDAELTGEAPCYSGWEFLAAVDTVNHDTDHPTFVLRSAPGVHEDMLDRSILAPGQCQHCNITRRNRIYTYLLRNQNTGDLIQVGSTCIKDFLGWEGRPVFLSVGDVAEDLDLDGQAGAGPVEYTPTTVIAVAWAMARRFGWVPASWHGTVTTRDRVGAYLYGRSAADGELRRECAADVSEATEQASTIIDTVLADLSPDSSGYAQNLSACLGGSAVQLKHLGLVVSAVAAYERAIGTHVQETHQQEDQVETAYAGVVGQKLTVTGDITRLIPVENNFGYQTRTSMLVIVQDGSIVAKMFTSARWAFDVEQGDTVTVTGTVKAHEAYDDIKQTVLTRPKLTQQPSPAEAHPTHQ